jgi:(1->4)-alpha-D-glucan 1-alpha-D-glucosylmutase
VDDALAVYRDRVQTYMTKAVREAKVESSWINVNGAYEAALSGFIDALLAKMDGNLFLQDFLPFQRRVAWLGMLNSLSQTLIKLTSPGVPDIYQGNELWDFSLVDPDNRRPVDYEHRGRLASRRGDAEVGMRRAETLSHLARARNAPRAPARVRPGRLHAAQRRRRARGERRGLRPPAG